MPEVKNAIQHNNIQSRRLFVRTAPDKLRILVKPIIGKKVEQALSLLLFSGRAASKPLSLTIKSAAAIAKDKNLEISNLYIKSILINEGPKLKRRRIVHQGRATAILKRMSHITVVLLEQQKHETKGKKHV